MQQNKILKGDLMDLFFSFEGRIGRSQYWVTSLLIGLSITPIFIIGAMFVLNYVTNSIFSFGISSMFYGMSSDMFMPALLFNTSVCSYANH